jgi:hypothetical protein
MSGISTYQAGQSDLELAARDLAVLLCPYDDSHPLLPTLEGSGGALDIPAYYISVGNFTKAAGVTLGHTPEAGDHHWLRAAGDQAGHAGALLGHRLAV